MSGEEKELENYLKAMLEGFESNSKKVKLVQEGFSKWRKEHCRKPSEEAFEEYLKLQFSREIGKTEK